MRPAAGEVLHFSEDPTIERFVPHVAPTPQQPEPYVWTVDHDQAPSCRFPRQCPLRLVGNLWPFRDEVIAGTTVHSGIRLRNAVVRPPGSAER